MLARDRGFLKRRRDHGHLAFQQCDGIQLLSGATGDVIGGTTSSAANVLQANTTGIEIGATGATGVTGNTVEGNVIGTGISYFVLHWNGRVNGHRLPAGTY
jgi:hypothetical protein